MPESDRPDGENLYASFPSPWEDASSRSTSSDVLINNSQRTQRLSIEVRSPMLSQNVDEGNDTPTKDQLDRKAAEMLNIRVDVDDDFTFKRRPSVPNSNAACFAPAQPAIRLLNGKGQPGRRNNRTVDREEAELSAQGTGRRVAYEDFTTIDWIHDLAKERVRQRHLLDAARYSWRGRARQLFDATQAWLVVLAVGVSVGILAGVIDVSSEWLSDLKDGYCTTAFYLNRNFCCWMIDEQEKCAEWVTWSDAFNVTNPTGSWLLEYLFYVTFATAFAGTSAVLVRTYAPYAAGSGIPEVKTILGGFVIRKFLGVWTLTIKSVGLVLSTAANMSLGKEGPLVHVACCCGNIFPRLFRKFKYNEAKKREILSAASAAGVSVAFGAPIGGVLFSLEEVSYYFPYKTMWRSFFCAMIAAVSLQVMNPFRTGKLVLFQVQYDRDWHGFELIFFVLLGIFGGLYGSFFIKYNIKLAAFRKRSRLRNFPVEEVLMIASFTGLVSYTNVFLRVGTVELVANLFKECENGDFHGLCKADSFNGIVTLLLISAVVKIGLTMCTFGVRVPAGIFMPSMAVGACVGRAMGMGVQAWQSAHKDFWLFAQCKPDVQCITPGTYAMVGAAATLGGVTRMTVSLVVIMFELTGALTYVLPIMIAVMTAKWVGDAFGKETIYDALCRLNGYPLLDSKEEYTHNVVASQVMTAVDDLVVIPSSGITLDGLNDFLHDTDFKGFPVVSNQRDMILVGFINRTELRYAINRGRHEQGKTGFTPCYFTSLPILEGENFVDLRPWTDQTPITVADIYPMDMVIDLFRKMGLRYVIVTNHGQLAGLITKKDVLRHINAMKHPETDANHLRTVERRRFPSAGALRRAVG